MRISSINADFLIKEVKDKHENGSEMIVLFTIHCIDQYPGKKVEESRTDPSLQAVLGGTFLH